MSDENVQVDRASIRRAWRRAGYRDFWLQLKTEGGDENAFADAVDETNERLPGGPFGGVSAQTRRGFVVNLDRTADEAQLSAWLTAFASHLDRAGFRGLLAGASVASIPRWLGYIKEREMTAFIGWTFDLAAMTADPERTSHWHVDADATATICQSAARWAEPGGPQVFISQDTFTFTLGPRADVGAAVIPAVLRGRLTGALRYVNREQRGRLARFTPGAQTVLQIIGGTESWVGRVNSLRDDIVSNAHLKDQAFVRLAGRGTISWSSSGRMDPLPGIESGDLRTNSHLLDRYVPDAHGIQVLRNEHLTNANDLSRWTITDLGHGRHLVEHPNLAAWYAHAYPLAGVVEQARRDFGAMILTKEIITANPPPWAK